MKEETTYDGRGNLLQSKKYENRKKEGIGTAAHAAKESAAHNDRLNRFHGSRGHGYAAEQGNDLIDRLKGKDAQILGDDNAKDGADRRVDGTLIQTKYCQNAKASINAGFRDGQYRYLDANGRPMQIEVPSDQYAEALEIMRKKIADGQVPGVTDPKEAENIVRKGNIDYKTARNIAKAGNIDSLSFDAVHGTVIAANAFGISATIVFAKAIWDGQKADKALDAAIYSGLQSGGIAFLSSVVTAQLTRTGINQVLMAPSIQIVRALPSNIRHALVNLFRTGAPIYGSAATNNLAKLMRSNLIAQAVLLAILSAGDITNFVRGRISGKQLFKDVATTVGGLGGAVAGGLVAVKVGGMIAASLVTGGLAGGACILVGTIAGGSLGGSGTHKALGRFIEDDAVQLLQILNARLIPLAQQYLLSEEELAIVIDTLRKELVQDKLLEMYASKDREAFADTLLTHCIEKTICLRARIYMPVTVEYMESISRVLTLSAEGGDYLQRHLELVKPDPVEIGKALMGQTLPQETATKAWYVTKQMNTVNTQAESVLGRMKTKEKEYRLRQRAQQEELEKYKAELDQFSEGDKQ